MSRVEHNLSGSYSWTKEVDMFENLNILKTVLKIVGCCFLGVFVFDVLLSFRNRDFFFQGLFETIKVFVVLTLIMMIIAVISYVVIAIIYGKYYCVIFEMDEKGIMHTQMEHQRNKAEVLSLTETITGVLSHNTSLVNSGLMTNAKSKIYTEFNLVKKIKTDRKYSTIILSYGLHQNQVYVEDEDYDDVLDFILKHCPKVKN